MEAKAREKVVVRHVLLSDEALGFGDAYGEEVV